MLTSARFVLACTLAAGCATTPAHPEATGPCATLRAKLTTLVSARDPALVPWAVDRLFVCEERDGWAWAFDALWVSVSGESDGTQTLVGDGNLVRVAPDGSQVGLVRAFHNGTEAYGAVTTITLVDLDADTVPEAVVRSRFDQDERVRERLEVFAVNQDRLVDIGAAWGVTVVDLRDVDDDGRADLIVTPYVADQRACGTRDRTEPVLGPSLLLHATSEGFVSDATSAAFTRAQCTLPPAPPYRDGDDIACARLFGVSAADVRASLSTACRTYGDVCKDIGIRPLEPAVPGQCPAWFATWAELEPPQGLQTSD